MLIIGAGMAGLLAAHMLRRYKPTIIERQPSLPNNHSAVLRFRSDAVSRATGIPFRKVSVSKAISFKGELYTSPSIRFQNMYSHKVTQEVLNRSIMNLQTAERWIAPEDFISQMARSTDILFNTSFLVPGTTKPIISTIPMPHLMNAVGWKDRPNFQYRTVLSLAVEISEPEMDVFQTLYYPGDEAWYRASITGNHVMVELSREPQMSAGEVLEHVMEDFGITDYAYTPSIRIKEQQYGKITPIEESVRKQFILAMSDLHHIYSVGRFATWRQILLDDVVKDIQIVESFITQRDNYNQRLAAHN